MRRSFARTAGARGLGLGHAAGLFLHADEELFERTIETQLESGAELAPHGDLPWDWRKEELRPTHLKMATRQQVFDTLAHSYRDPLPELHRDVDNGLSRQAGYAIDPIVGQAQSSTVGPTRARFSLPKVEVRQNDPVLG